MRILGKLAVAAGATAVILLTAPGANAADLPTERTASAMDAVPRTDPLGAVKGLLGKLTGALGGVGGGALGGATGGTGVSGLGLGG
jgi:hypothetical protein